MTEQHDSCRPYRDAIQERLDGAVEAVPEARLDEHLGTCDACRRYDAELRVVQGALRALPEHPLPADALQQVWSKTLDREPRHEPVLAWLRGWRMAAAAAALAMVVAIGWLGWRGTAPQAPGGLAVADRADDPAGPVIDPEMQKAVDEARYALALTSQALARSRRAAVEDVLEGQVQPALERIMIDWPNGSGHHRRRPPA